MNKSKWENVIFKMNRKTDSGLWDFGKNFFCDSSNLSCNLRSIFNSFRNFIFKLNSHFKRIYTECNVSLLRGRGSGRGLESTSGKVEPRSRRDNVDCYEVSWLTQRNNGTKLVREVGASWHQP